MADARPRPSASSAARQSSQIRAGINNLGELKALIHEGLFYGSNDGGPSNFGISIYIQKIIFNTIDFWRVPVCPDDPKTSSGHPIVVLRASKCVLLRIVYYCDALSPTVIPSEVLPSAGRRAERSRGTCCLAHPEAGFSTPQRGPLSAPFAALEMTEIVYVSQYCVLNNGILRDGRTAHFASWLKPERRFNNLAWSESC